MITLFRRIRQKLIDSGSLTKYLLYALGEVALVMIGILLALQVNNWNQDRIEENLAQEYQLRLLDDLYDELSVIETVKNYNSIVLDHAQSAIRVFESSPVKEREPLGKDFLIDLYQASQIQDATGRNATYKELQSSGQIGKIKNDSLRASIISYYVYDWPNSVSFKISDPYRESVRKVIPSFIQDEIRKMCGDVFINRSESVSVTLNQDCSIEINEQTANKTANEILKNDIIQNDLRYRIGNLNAQLQLLNFLKTNLERIIAQLEREV